MAFTSQLRLLLWKNWLLQKRRVCVSVFEVLLPVGFALIILGIRGSVTPWDHPHPVIDTSSDSLIPTDYYLEENVVIGFAPNNTETAKVMSTVDDLFRKQSVDPAYSKVKNFTVKGFNDEKAALEYVKHHLDSMKHLITFYDVDSDSSSLPKHVRFAVRPYTDSMSHWLTQLVFPKFQDNGPSYMHRGDFYRSRGVLYMQSLVGEALARYRVHQAGGDPDDVKIVAKSQQLPYPPYLDDPMIGIIQDQLPLFLVLGFILSVIVNTKNLIYEKERKLKESMKLMGLRASVHWISWFITFMVYLVPAMLIFALLLGCNLSNMAAVLGHSDILVFFVFLICYAFAIVSFCFMVSSFVQKANVGAALSGVLFYFSYQIPYSLIQQNSGQLSKSTKLASMLLCNNAMALGANTIGLYEGTGEGAQWSNISEPASVDDNLSLVECMVMLLVDTGIHMVITWYLDNVRPGEFGVPKPFYFCFTKNYWCGQKVESDAGIIAKDQDSKYFEKTATDLKAGIKINNLKKKFGSKVAVAGTCMDMFEGQISVLLGHNGAGKTTTMSMLTGFIPPTSGTAIVNGYDIRTNIDDVRSSLGLCPQHDILFDTMTVMEHLEFFAKLKGASGPKLAADVLHMAQEVGLETKLHAQSRSLSGGQKRKLSVGIALVGGSKVVILDEPTSGMDPGARRQTWGVLQRARQGRTLVLSTHYMDEADLLGDRIAIMHDGAIKCCGSSMFLKKLYGAGYHLVAVKEDGCDVNVLTEVVKSHVANAELETVINREVTYLLPDSESGKFASLFRDLEKQKTQLGLISFGTSATTMEEVFLKVGETSEEGYDEMSSGVASSHSNNSFQNEAFLSSTEGIVDARPSVQAENKEGTEREYVPKRQETDYTSFNKGFTKKVGLDLELSRIRGLFVKKAISTWRNRKVTLVQLLLPVIFTIVALSIEKAIPQDTQSPELVLDLSPFGGTVVPYTSGNKSSASYEKFAHVYASQFSAPDTPLKFDILEKSYQKQVLEKADAMGLPSYKKRVIVGMEPKPSDTNTAISAVAFYSGEPYHGLPIAVNYLMNAFLQYYTDGEYSLQSSVHPLPRVDDKKESQSQFFMSSLRGFLVGICITFGMSFMTSLFIHFLVKERQVGAKHMQIVSGVGPLVFWIPTFLWDLISYTVPCLVLLVVFAAYGTSAYVEDGRWALVLLVLVIYGWAVLPFMYALNFMFKSPPTATVLVIVLNIMTGLVTTLVVFIMGQLNAGDSLNWIFMVLCPNYNMAQSFINIYTNYVNTIACSSGAFVNACKVPCHLSEGTCLRHDSNYLALSLPGIGYNIIFMILQGFVFMLVVLFIEYHMFQRMWYLIRGRLSPESEHGTYEECVGGKAVDSDVAAETQRVLRSPVGGGCPTRQVETLLAPKDSLLLVNLFKCYGSNVAVDHICLGVPEQECFGLLGQNGAGKTTTFKMLTGDVMVTSGNAYLKGFDVRNNIKQVQANMGYCPQFDALIEQMTGRETLTMYARLRGVPEPSIKVVVNFLLDILMLTPHADKQSGQYSGGNKRKLSTAIALVGDPPFIILDEPSSGMDPKARRQLWNVLSQVRASGRTLVLTSHSMEECDALCTRLAIMVNGKFMCLGSPQQLKNKFGHGYTLIVQLGILDNGEPAPNQPVIDFIQHNLPGTQVFDDQQGYVHFQVPDSNVHIADVFEIMESTKVNLDVDDYSVHQTTLEQVFLGFTRGQVMPAKQMKRVFCCRC